MKKLLLLLLVINSLPNRTEACTVCGCSASNQYLGILPQSRHNFAGVQYQYRAFESMHHPVAGELTGSTSNEYYHTAQAWGRYHITPRIQVFAFLPYATNTRIENKTRITNSGIGDATILVNYKAINSGNNWRHSLLTGIGVKLPTGRYNKKAIQLGEAMPNMQPGTASFDFILNANYTIQRNSVGINTDISFVATTTNEDKYKFGNRLQAGILAFYSFKKEAFSIIPQLGCRYEYAFNDYDNYVLGIQNNMSGGNQLYTSAGVQFFYKSVGLQAMAHLPIAQHYAGGLVNNKLKVESGIYLLFNN